jgi:hypothetical protein
MYGVLFQPGRMSIVALGLESLCEWALKMACSNVVVSLSGWNSGRKRNTPDEAVSVRGSAEKRLLNGSSK